MAFPDKLVYPVYFRNPTGATISTATTLYAGPFCNPFSNVANAASAVFNHEIVDVEFFDTTANAGSGAGAVQWNIRLCKGSIATPITAAHLKITDVAPAVAATANVPLRFSGLDGVHPNISTTLSAAITTKTATSITVTAATAFPQTGQFQIKVDDEIMFVTAGAGTTTWTVTRAASAGGVPVPMTGNTLAATHANGATVSLVTTAEARRISTVPTGGGTVADVLHLICTPTGAVTALSANFLAVAWISSSLEYAAQTYPAAR